MGQVEQRTFWENWNYKKQKAPRKLNSILGMAGWNGASMDYMHLQMFEERYSFQINS